MSTVPPIAAPTTPAPNASPGFPLFRNPLFKLALVGALATLLAVPLMLVSLIRGERAERAAEASREIAAAWGGEQAIAGPFLIVPVSARAPEAQDGRAVTRQIVLLPADLSQTADIAVETRRRGIFDTPVWRGAVDVKARFTPADLARLDPSIIAARWEEAVVAFHVADPRGLTREVVARVGGRGAPLDIGPAPFGGQVSVLQAPLSALGLGEGAGFEIEARFEMNGTRALAFAPLARNSTLAMTANWPHPSFFGALLPAERSVTEAGFTASWTVPHYARASVGDAIADAQGFTRALAARSGARFFQPVDIYQQVERALKYGVLVIGAAFFVVFLVEVLSRRSFHPVQYVFTGAALVMFYVLLLSLAEHVGFPMAYALATAAVVGLVSVYVGLVFRRAREGAIVAAQLAFAYGLLYVILGAEDVALLAGAITVFLALAAAMLLTARTDWTALGKSGPESLSSR